MSYTTDDYTETLDRLSKIDHGFSRGEIKTCLYAYGKTGDRADWSGGFIVELVDGRKALILGWCDTTGWGCRDGIEAYLLDESPADLQKV